MNYKRRYPPISNAQLEALRRHIACLNNISDIGKKAVIFLLDHSENLSLPVRMSMPGEIGNEIQEDVHAMRSSGRDIQIHFFFDGMGTEMDLFHHCGLYRDGKFDYRLSGSTIWISVKPYDDESEPVTFNLEEIQKVKLFKWQ